jgi:hypothetical protein
MGEWIITMDEGRQVVDLLPLARRGNRSFYDARNLNPLLFLTPMLSLMPIGLEVVNAQARPQALRFARLSRGIIGSR